MLQIDKKPHASKLFCKACHKFREILLFSPIARQEPYKTRKCLGHERAIWICPHRIWSREDMSNVRPWEDHNRAPCVCPVSTVHTSDDLVSVLLPWSSNIKGQLIHWFFQAWECVLPKPSCSSYHLPSDSRCLWISSWWMITNHSLRQTLDLASVTKSCL